MKNKTQHLLVSGFLFAAVTPNTYASGGLSSPIDDGSFTEKQRQAMLLQTLTDRRPIQTSEKNENEEKMPSVPSVNVGEMTIEADEGARAFGVVRAKGSTTDVDISRVTVKAKGTSKAVAYMEGDVDMS